MQFPESLENTPFNNQLVICKEKYYFVWFSKTRFLYSYLFRHLFIAHKQGHLYKCPDCPQEMASLMGLELHRQRIHGLPKQPKMHQSVAMNQFKIEND